MAAVSTDGRTVCVLIRCLNSSHSPLDGVDGPTAAPLARRQPREREEPVASFLQAVDDGAIHEPPFADGCMAARLDFRSRRGIDWQRSHRAAARVHAPAGCGACATGAALDRYAIPDGGDRVIEPRSPSTMRNSAETGHRDPLPKGRPMEAHTKIAADGEEDHLVGGRKREDES